MATPDSGYRVASWGDDCSGTATTCVVTMDADRTASVTFEPVTHTLTVTATGGGSVSPGGTTAHLPGASVTLTASWNDVTHTFMGWGGDCSGTASTCPLTMSADKTVTATFGALCASGTAVSNPGANSDLVRDCGRLLLLKDTLAGTGTLNWSASTAITGWTGVTVGGSPQRVTRLSLASSGLTGELSGLLGALTGLEQLRLNGNSLAGSIPSKLEQLIDLTHVYLSGNTLSGCLPLVLRMVANSDVTSLGLPDCPAPTDISYGEHTLGEGTYRFALSEDEPPLIFDVPAGLQLEIVGMVLSDSPGGGRTIGLILRDPVGRSWICLDVVESEECNRRIVTTTGSQSSADGGAGTKNSGPDTGSLFDRISESLWMDDAP